MPPTGVFLAPTATLTDQQQPTPQSSQPKQWLHPLHRRAASQRKRTKENPVKMRKEKKRKNTGRSSEYIKKTSITIATQAEGEGSLLQ